MIREGDEMRNAVIGFVLIIILVISGLTILTVHNKTIRENELDTNLGIVMEQSLTLFAMNGEHAEHSNGEELLIADLIQNFLLKTTSNSEFTVNVLTADTKKGILDVEVIEKFTQFGGTIGYANCRKTVVLEVYENIKNEYFPISFYVDDQIIKFIQLYGGSNLQQSEPEIPKKEGYEFQGWELNNDGRIYKELSFITVTKEMKFKACFILKDKESI